MSRLLVIIRPWANRGWQLQGGYHRRLRRRIEATLPEGEAFPVPTLHGLRYSAAILMLEQNIHLKIVRGILGHRKIETTLYLYQHVPADLHWSAPTPGKPRWMRQHGALGRLNQAVLGAILKGWPGTARKGHQRGETYDEGAG